MFTKSTHTRSAAVLAAACSHLALADTIHVAPCGNNAWTGAADVCAEPDGPKAAIQAAIDAASDGDIVLVADGTYSGPGNRDMDFGGKAITVQSVSGAEACVIDLQGTPGDPHRAFHFHSGEGVDSVLDGFTIENGYMEIRGGAMLCQVGSSPVVQGCVFAGNKVNGTANNNGGGAVCIFSSDPSFTDCSFIANSISVSSVNTGGGAVYSLNANPTFTTCQFTMNSVTDAERNSGGGAMAFGGGIAANEPLIEICTFTQNTASSDGGAVLNAQMSNPHYVGCTFQQNSAVFRGGAMITVAMGSATVIDCDFIENTTTSPDSGAGGALYCHPDDSVFNRCRFVENVSANSGGAVGMTNEFANPTDVTFVSCEFRANHALNGPGGGILVEDATATLINCLVVDNTASGMGGALWAEADATVSIVNSTLANNDSESGAGGVQSETNAQVGIDNAIIWGNSSPQIGVGDAGVTVTYSDIQGGWAGTGNIDCDPQFLDPGMGNYHPSAACVTDSGDNCAVPDGIDTDLDANPRFVDYPGAPDFGAPGCQGGERIVDMGAFERQCTADCNGDGARNILDFVCFQQQWQAQAALGDCDGNGEYDILDFVCFQGVFVEGCR